jgi:phosphatidate cytidylyltransferase
VLKQRVITALVLLGMLVGALWLGRVAFVAAIAVLFGAALFEWWRLAGIRPAPGIALAVAVVGSLVLLEVSGRSPVGPVLTLICAGAAAVWLTLLAVLVRAQQQPVRIGARATAALGLAVLPAAWLALLYLHGRGVMVMLSVLAIVWVADIAAYFAGRAFGRRKLASNISPGKTWAGVGGAIVGVLVVATAAQLAWPGAPLLSNVFFRHSLFIAWILLAALVMFSIVGDLFESLLKRRAGVKDSGGLLPGHGGVLDRIDALLPVLPIAVLLERWIR